MRFQYCGSEYVINNDLCDCFSISEKEVKIFLDLLEKILGKRMKYFNEENIFFFKTIDKLNKSNQDYFYKVKECHKVKPGVLEIYIPMTKYYINISDTLKNLLLFLISSQILEEIELSVLINVIVNVIYPSINKIEDFEYCVLFTIISMSKNRRNILERIIYTKEKREFELNDIWEHMKLFCKKDCNNHSDLWTCPYAINDTCFISKDKIENVIESLMQKKIIAFTNGGKYKLIY